MKKIKKGATYAAVALIATTSYCTLNNVYADEITSGATNDSISLDDLVTKEPDMPNEQNEPTLTEYPIVEPIDSEVSSGEENTMHTQDEPTPAKEIENKKPDELVGTYEGNGLVKIGNTKVRVVSKFLTKADIGSEIKLTIDGTLRSFKLREIMIDGKSYPAKVTENVTSKPEFYQKGIFDVTGAYAFGKIKFISGDTQQIRNLKLKNSEEFEGKTISFKIKGTINDFKIVSPIIIVE